MAKIVRMVAGIRAEACTGCRLCEVVCPSIAIRMRPRRADEPGRGRLVAELEAASCCNAQGCLEICPEGAIVMRPLERPIVVGTDLARADADAVAAVCLAAGFTPAVRVRPCTETRAGEIAAAVLLGADTPEAVSLRTGARTGCTELCQQPILRLLAAAGHPDPPRALRHGAQWDGRAGSLVESLGARGEVPRALEERWPQYLLRRDRNVLLGNLEEA